MRQIHLWVEDSVGGCIFWETLMGCIFPNVIVSSKGDSSRLSTAVKKLQDDRNLYLIVYDHSFDNQSVMRELHSLQEAILKRSNVFEINLISFEYVLLEFELLIDWIYAPDDEFLVKRANLIDARKKLLDAFQNGNFDYKEIPEIKNLHNSLDKYNVEQLVSDLLYKLTRNTEFLVEKGKLGGCWITDCCSFVNRQEDDVCGLDTNRLSVKEKMELIYKNSSLVKELYPILGGVKP